MKAQITSLPCSRLAIFAICNVIFASRLFSLHRKMIWLNFDVISQKAFKGFFSRKTRTHVVVSFQRCIFCMLCGDKEKCNFFSLSLLYIMQTFFFGVIFMGRNLFNLVKVYFFTFACILLLESHWASGLSSSNRICRYNDTCIFPDSRLGTGGWRRVTRLALNSLSLNIKIQII